MRVQHLLFVVAAAAAVVLIVTALNSDAQPQETRQRGADASPARSASAGELASVEPNDGGRGEVPDTVLIENEAESDAKKAESFDVHSGPYAYEHLSSLPIERLKEIRALIRDEQSAERAKFESSLTDLDPFVPAEQYHSEDMECSSDIYLPIRREDELRYYRVDQASHPKLYVWRERATAVLSTPAYAEDIDARRSAALAEVEENLGVTDFETVMSPNNDFFAVYATVAGQRRRVAIVSDASSY